MQRLSLLNFKAQFGPKHRLVCAMVCATLIAVPVPSSSLEPLTQMSMSCHAIACTITTVHNHASLSSFNRIRRHFDQYILYIEPYVVLHAPVIALPHQPNVSQRSLVCSCRSICFTARAHCPRLFDHQLVGLPN